MSQSTDPSSPVERAVEKVKGTAKEAAGTIMGKEELRKEGEQQEEAAMRGQGTEQEAQPRENLGPGSPGASVSPDDRR